MEALHEGVLLVPLDPRYTQVGFNLISVQVCKGMFLNVERNVSNVTLSHPTGPGPLVTKSKNWTKMNKHLKSYTSDLVSVTSSVLSSESVVSALLKHVHAILEYFAALPKSAKGLLKTLVSLWSTHKDDKVRVLAYMCVLKLANLKKEMHREGE